MTLKTAFFALALTVFVSGAAFAASLEEYKSQGLVGEQLNGLVGSVNTIPTAEVKSLIDSINNERVEKYKAVAKKNGLKLNQVQALAGKKLITQTPEGDGLWVQNSGGYWVQR